LKKKFKRWFGIAAAVFVAAFAALNFAAYRQAYSMTHFVAGRSRTAKPENLSLGQKLIELMGVPAFPGAALLVFWGGWQFGFNGFGNNPVEYAASVRCPILFLHGAADGRAHLAEARQVYDAVPGRKWFKEFAGIGHAPIVVPCRREWKETVSRFLKDAKVEAEVPASASHG